MKLNPTELKQAIERVKKSLLDQKAKSAKFGLDIGKQWKDMQNTIKK